MRSWKSSLLSLSLLCGLSGCLAEVPNGPGTDRATATSGIAKLSYTPVQPCRIVDTRARGGALAAGEKRSFVVRGDVAAQGGRAAGCVSPVGEAHAVHVNITVFPRGSGNLKLFPTGSSSPYAAFVNFKAGLQAVANAGITKSCVGCATDIDVATKYGGADVVIDVLGYLAPSGGVTAESDRNLVYTPIAPCRIADTRKAGGRFAANEKRSLRIHGAVASQGGNVNGCVAPQGEPRAAHIKLVAVPGSGTAEGNVAVSAKGRTPPAGLLIYHEGGQNIANAAIVPTLYDDNAEEIDLLNRQGQTHLVVDVLGYYYERDTDDPPEGQDLLYVPVLPCRVADTRHAGGTLAPDEQLSLRVYGAVADQGGEASNCSAPLGEPRAAHLNIVAVPRHRAGNIAIDAVDAGMPSAGIVNYNAAFQNIADAATVRTAFNNTTAPDITLKNRYGQTDVVVHALGYFYGSKDQPGPVLDGVVNLTPDHQRTAASPAVSVSGAHRWIAWVEYDHTADNSLLRATRFDGAAQVAGPLEVASGHIMSPQVVSEDNGDAWFFWIQLGASGGRLKARHRTASGWDSGPMDVAPGKAGYPAAHLDGSGQPWVVFEKYKGEGTEIQGTHWTGSSFATPTRLSQAGVNAYQPAIELDAEQALWVAWHAYKNSNYDVFTRRRVSGSFGATWKVTDANDSSGRHLGFHVNPTIHRGCCGVVWIGWVAKGPEARVKGTKPHLYGRIAYRRLQLRRIKPDGARDPVHQVPVPVASMQRPDTRTHQSGPEGITIANSPGKVGVFYRLVTRAGQVHNWRAFVQHMTVSDGRWLATPYEVSGGGLTGGYSNAPAAAHTDAGMLVAWQQDNRADVRLNAGFVEPPSDILVREILAKELPATSAPGQALQRYSPPLRFDMPRPRLTTVHDGQTLQLLVGDLHAHSQFSLCGDGGPMPEHPLREAYRVARDMAALDFYVATDHDHHMSNHDWWVHKNQCRLQQRAGGLTTLLGVEHTSSELGHQNVIYDGCEGDNVSHYAFATPEQLFDQLPYKRAIAIPHHPAHWKAWSWWDMRRFDPSYNRLYEIYQVRGSFECYSCVGVYRDLYAAYANDPAGGFKSIPADAAQGRGYFQDALAMGHRIGAIASPDHGGTWGVAGVYAASRSPKDLFDALWARRTFGVSSAIARLALELRADGHFMGEAYSKTSGSCPTLTGRVRTDYVDPATGAHGTIKQIKIFRVDVGQPVPGENGEVFKLSPNGKSQVTFTYHDASCPGSGSAAYYLRAIQSDISGVDVPERPSIGWTSPVFVDWK